MKLVLFLIGMAAACFLGYSYEPGLRLQLTGIAPVPEKTEPVRIVIPVSAPIEKIDPASIPTDRLPKKIVLKADAEVATVNADLKMTIPAGSRVILVRLDGDNAIISPGSGPLQGSLPISDTDLLEQIASMPPAPTPAPSDSKVNDAVPTIPEPAAPVVDPTPVETPEPQTAEEIPEAMPEPEVAESEPPTPVEDDIVDIVAVMQNSIKAGEIEEFSFDQVHDWKASDEPEIIDGQSYQTGIASYKAETVFGVKTIQAKALIKDGKVASWLWPKSGMEIK